VLESGSHSKAFNDHHQSLQMSYVPLNRQLSPIALLIFHYLALLLDDVQNLISPDYSQ